MKRFLGMGWLTGFLVLGFLGVVPTEVQAQSNRYQYLRTCQQVRNYRSQNNLNSRELLTLEYQYCVLDDPYYSSYYRRRNPIVVPTPSISASQDCIDATILTRLAIASEPYGGTLTSEALGLQQTLCLLPNLEQNQREDFQWRNGRSVKFGNNWYYPNGKNAKFQNTWYYPNGENVQFGKNLYYPNGRNAKFGKTWYYPNGESTTLASLVSWSCGILSYYECQDRLADLQTTQGFWYDLAVIELANRAYYEIYNYRRYDSDSHDDLDIDIDIIIK